MNPIPYPTRSIPPAEFSTGREIAYGYMRVPCSVPDWKIRELETCMRAFAASRELTLVQIFAEFHCGAREAYSDLLDVLKTAPARTVVVPSLRHLAINSCLQELMMRELERTDASEEGLGVLALDEFGPSWHWPVRAAAADGPQTRIHRETAALFATAGGTR